MPSFVIWSVSGLENSLLALAVVGTATVLVVAALDDRLLTVHTAVVCGLLAGLAGLTRPDGIIYAAAYPLAVAVFARSDKGRRIVQMIVLSLATAAVPIASYLGWRLLQFGAWLPNTALAKGQTLPALSDLNKPTDLFGYVGWLGCGLFVAVVVLAFQRRSPTRTALTMLVIPFGLALVSYAVLATDWMTQFRFATPVWPLASLMLALALAETLRRPALRGRVVAAAVVALIAVVTINGWRRQSDTFLDRPTVSVCAVARNTGYTFNTYADRLGIRQGSLLAVDGGGTSLTSRLRFVDLSGLTDARIAGYWEDGDMEGLRDHVFDDVRPTFIRIWFGWDGIVPSGILDDPRLERDYVLIWGPPEGGGNWVRRDAVADDPVALERLQRRAPELAAAVDAPWAREQHGLVVRTHAPSLRPGRRPTHCAPDLSEGAREHDRRGSDCPINTEAVARSARRTTPMASSKTSHSLRQMTQRESGTNLFSLPLACRGSAVTVSIATRGSVRPSAGEPVGDLCLESLAVDGCRGDDADGCASGGLPNLVLDDRGMLAERGAEQVGVDAQPVRVHEGVVEATLWVLDPLHARPARTCPVQQGDLVGHLETDRAAACGCRGW